MTTPILRVPLTFNPGIQKGCRSFLGSELSEGNSFLCETASEGRKVLSHVMEGQGVSQH